MEETANDPPAPVVLDIANTPDPIPTGHPQTAEIIRQVEFYFGEENLPYDAHLLGLFREGNGSVSFNEITGFKAMRKFKPKTAVREALRKSTVVEVSADGKRLSRKTPLETRLKVIPKINRDRKKVVVPDDKPWLTKAMMKPTGFEPYATDGPIRPEEYAQDRSMYDPEIVFTSRIETAITRFCARRKMHQKTRMIFDKFMMFGGMDCGQRQFMGGVDDKANEDYTKKELAELTSNYGVSERVLDGLVEDEVDEHSKWIVNFETVAKAFLSSHVVQCINWYDAEEVATATNVLRNFYNYLLLHDVCPEYRDQLMAARMVCDQADEELPKLKEVDLRLPGGFNVACSTLFGGSYVNVHASGGDWARADDNLGWSKLDAMRVFKTGIFAHGTLEQLDRMEEAEEEGILFKAVYSEELGLEITGVEFPKEEAAAVYKSDGLSDTIVRPMGKLKCKRWDAPHAAPRDLPRHVIERQKTENFEFLVDEETLQYCLPGMKMQCCVKTLDLGIRWIDCIDTVYASFFTWLANERIREWKEPGPPKEWMLRQDGADNEGGEGNEGQPGEEPE